MDNLSNEKRSWNMSLIRSKNTKPELVVRKFLFARGFRYRLHGNVSKKIINDGILPGKPDIVLSLYKTVVFVNGCFWHGHQYCKKNHLPKTNTTYWRDKINRNITRDEENYLELEKLGFKVLVVWECEIKDLHYLEKLIKEIKGEKI